MAVSGVCTVLLYASFFTFLIIHKTYWGTKRDGLPPTPATPFDISIWLNFSQLFLPLAQSAWFSFHFFLCSPFPLNTYSPRYKRYWRFWSFFVACGLCLAFQFARRLRMEGPELQLLWDAEALMLFSRAAAVYIAAKELLLLSSATDFLRGLDSCMDEVRNSNSIATMTF